MSTALGLMSLAVRTVFSRRQYAALGAAVTVAMMVGLLAASDYVFFEPYVVGHIPPGGELGFVMISAIAALSGLTVPVGVMSVRTARKGFAGGLAGTTVGVAAGACSCGPLGFALASSLGAAGTAAASFLTAYDVPLRLAAIAALLISLYAASSAIAQECRAARPSP